MTLKHYCIGMASLILMIVFLQPKAWAGDGHGHDHGASLAMAGEAVKAASEGLHEDTGMIQSRRTDMSAKQHQQQ